MQRRSLMKLGAASAAVLALGGGLLATITPGVAGGKLTAEARIVFRTVAAAILQGVLAEGPPREAEISAWMHRVESLIDGLPPHAQAELSQLLAVLCSPPGRRYLATLDTPWEHASVQETQRALQAMRASSIALRQQAYQALHDIVNGAYFSDPVTWRALGYPGPLAL